MKVTIYYEYVTWDGDGFDATPSWVDAAMQLSHDTEGALTRKGLTALLTTRDGVEACLPGDKVLRVEGRLCVVPKATFAVLFAERRPTPVRDPPDQGELL